MNASRIRYLVGAAVVVVASSMTPASAETYVTQAADCNYGDASSVQFTENADNAAWEVSATYRNKGGSNKQSPGKLYAVTAGTYRITFTPSGPKQKIVAISVRSSNSVQAAGGHQCTTINAACANCLDTAATPVDDLNVPLVPTDVPVPSQILSIVLD